MTTPTPRIGTDLDEKPGEPVAVAELVRLGFAALAGVGWLVVPDTTVNLIGTAIAAIVSIVATILARRRVTPVKEHVIVDATTPPSPGS